MSRSFPGEEPSRAVALSSSTGSSKSPFGPKVPRELRPPESAWDFWAARAFFVAATVILCYTLGPFHLHGWPAAGTGLLTALVILLAELRLRRAAASGLLGGAFGGILGIFAALLVTLVISRCAVPEPTKFSIEFSAFLALSYLGLVLGWQKGGELPLHVETIGKLFGGRTETRESLKLLDTSVLIDGRIADICDAQFIDGPLIVPQFVLRELQLVADSSDGLKRQRGRRGLDVLERIQKMPGVEVRILDHDPSQVGEVDHKLIELARRTGAKIVTNDFNLNKVATVQGLSVLNVNQLANALKPVVLPGEPMRVFILREGKEANQGVAYLDDGTMVVVDGARRFINKNVDTIVTSVHQTTAGKMIFGRMDERAEQTGSMARQAAAGASRSEGGGRAADPVSLDRGPRPIFPETDSD
jgi:uncharacterized protein YacL